MYGEPMKVSDRVTVVPVSAPAGRFRGARPLGVFAIIDGDVVWRPATDDTAIALLGISVGMVATVLSLTAVIRNPPWLPSSRWPFSRTSTAE
ncbi:hypothetical protein ACH46_07935 [Gordonia phthalatica]|uniref:Uncharacterized protein n=2 Tax=Gordonia phthalatica TaxID=1136941 RepID=A0A0N7FVB7_9ACTN|nr:hypothetical protein ACH46_07935 [Gordonia phthalatica]